MFSLAKNTLPNAPDPRVLMIVNDEKLTLFVVISFSYLVKISFYCNMAFFLSSGSSLFPLVTPSSGYSGICGLEGFYVLAAEERVTGGSGSLDVGAY
jgi:hypothetical protein